MPVKLPVKPKNKTNATPAFGNSRLIKVLLMTQLWPQYTKPTLLPVNEYFTTVLLYKLAAIFREQKKLAWQIYAVEFYLLCLTID